MTTIPGPTTAPATGPTIGTYLTELASRLRGPRRLRAELVMEVRTGLEEATAALL